MNNLLNLKNIFVNASLLGLLLISGANPALAADQAAFVYVAHKNDYGWSYSHDIGRGICQHSCHPYLNQATKTSVALTRLDRRTGLRAVG